MNEYDSIKPLGIGWIIEFTQDWADYKKGQQLVVESIEFGSLKRRDVCTMLCSGCIKCEGWTSHFCLTDASNTDKRIFKVISSTGHGLFREGRDIINIVGMV